jgi:hypothetical protein
MANIKREAMPMGALRSELSTTLRIASLLSGWMMSSVTPWLGSAARGALRGHGKKQYHSRRPLSSLEPLVHLVPKDRQGL